MPEAKPTSTTRRSLLIGGAATIAAGTAAALHFKPWYRPLGANSDIRLGIAGLGGKGLDHINHFSEIPGCRITAICDPDPNQAEKIFAESPLKKEAVTLHSDFRKLIEDKEVDAIVIATPNHWHALMGVWAMQAGKHVYVEKPIAHSIWEGQMLVDTAAATGMIAQSGTQRRSDAAYAEAAAWLAEGHLGKLTSAHAIVFRKRKAVTRRKSPTPMPTGIDYDHWCGPAPKDELYRAKLHYDWHWHWSTGDGELGNNGIHFLDVARIILGESGIPNTTTSIGGRLGWGEDAGQTPNSHIVHYDYKIPLFAEIRNLPSAKDAKHMDAHAGIREGLVIHCEGGTLAWPKAKDTDGKTLKKFDSQDGHGHRVNWLKAIAENRPQDLNAPLKEGHISSALCHLGNASHRTGKTAAANQLPTTESVQSLLAHLQKNEVNLDNTPLTLGQRTSLESANAKPTFRPGYDFQV